MIDTVVSNWARLQFSKFPKLRKLSRKLGNVPNVNRTRHAGPKAIPGWCSYGTSSLQ